MHRVSFVLVSAILATSLSGCVVEERGYGGRPAAHGYRNHGQERREEVHERNAERKAEHKAEKREK